MTSTKALTLAPLSGVPSMAQWRTMTEVASVLVQSGLLPRGIDTAQKAAAVILKGAELDIPPMQAFAHIAVISGKPACSAELHLALLARGGVTWEWEQDGSDGIEAAIVFHRPGFPQPFRGHYSFDEAKRAGLLGNPTWAKYLPAMLRARAITSGARMFGADLLGGMSYTPEELGATVDEDGEVVEVVDAVVTPMPTEPKPDPGPQPARTHDEPEDIDFNSESNVRVDLLTSIKEMEQSMHINVPKMLNSRKKHAGTEKLEEADTAGLKAYLARLLEYHREQAEAPKA